MKYSNSMLGGNIRPENIPPTRILQKFREAYAAAGVTVRAVNPQNEIEWRTRAGDAGVSGPEEGRGTPGRGARPTVQSSGATKNLERSTQLQFVLAAPRSTLEAAIQEIREHCGPGTDMWKPEMMGNVKQKFPDVEMHWTEGGDDLQVR